MALHGNRFSPQFLTGSEFVAYQEFAKQRSDYTDVQRLFGNDPGIEEYIVQYAAAYVLFEKRTLDVKLAQLTGFTAKKLDSLRTDVWNLANTIESLNRVRFPGGSTAIELILDKGREDLSPAFYPGSESNEALVAGIKRLPFDLRMYAGTLLGWPHPKFRAQFSER